VLGELFNSFKRLSVFSAYSEGWAFINFKGIWQDNQDIQILKDVNAFIETNALWAIIWNLDGQVLDFHTFLDELASGSAWSLNVNKISRLSESKTTFFYDLDVFKIWSKQLNPFDSLNPLLSSFKTRIIVNEFSEKVKAVNYIVCNTDDPCEFAEIDVLPSFSKINATIHIAARENFVVEPSKLFITEGECTELTFSFFKMAALSLSVCVVSELINDKLVVLRGIRKIEMDLFNNVARIDLAVLEDLKNTVSWIYEDKTDLKLKLFLDRFTLDVDLKKDYTSEFILLNRTSLEQAKERFSFITFERKDQYQKELRDLLKDIKGVSDLYSTKVRGVLSNLLRDVLAGLILIGITILSKIEKVDTVASSPIINLVFKAFAFYFILSILYQTIFDFIDISKTKSEFIFWKQTSREYIGQDEFKKLMAGTIDKREIFTYSFYSLLIITYLGIAYLSYNFIGILQAVI